MPFEVSQPRNFLLLSSKRSSVPQAIHRRLSPEVEFEVSPGNLVSNSTPKPAALNTPIQANLSSEFNPAVKDSPPPIDNPAMARESRFRTARYVSSICGTISESRISLKLS